MIAVVWNAAVKHDVEDKYEGFMGDAELNPTQPLSVHPDATLCDIYHGHNQIYRYLLRRFISSHIRVALS